MEIRYLEQNEKEWSRELYEDSFPEDSEKFTDYYYTEKCRDNRILVMEDQDRILSMIHLNPFQVSMYGQDARVHYIVAVATAREYRRRGYMFQLMKRVFHDLYQEKEPFAFLMPANPDYYYSSGFEYWASQIELKQDQGTIWEKDIRVEGAKESDCRELAEYSNRVLAPQFDLYIRKDEAYYKRLLKEQRSEDGQVVVIRRMDGTDPRNRGEICGIFSFDMDGGVQIREPVMADSCTECVHPVMMGRILNLERFCAMIKSTEELSMEVEIRDTMIPENNGWFQIRADKNGGQASRLYGSKPELSMDIAEFGKMIFDNMRIYINEVV